ncbi:MAG: GFA family protein [Burkholderiaceae bacterium]
MITGSCLCGAVSLEIDEPLEKSPEACHCTQCRKQTGNFFVGVNVRRSALRVTGEEHITWYQSSEQVQRGFCSKCGSALFWKPTIPGYEWTSVMLGCLNTSMQLTIAKHIFVANKGSYYEITDGAPQLEKY